MNKKIEDSIVIQANIHETSENVHLHMPLAPQGFLYEDREVPSSICSTPPQRFVLDVHTRAVFTSEREFVPQHMELAANHILNVLYGDILHDLHKLKYLSVQGDRRSLLEEFTKLENKVKNASLDIKPGVHMTTAELEAIKQGRI